MSGQEFERLPEDIGVIGAAQPPVGRNNDQFDLLISPDCQQRVALLRDASRQAVEHREHLPGIGTRGNDTVLGFAQPCSRDEFHRAGDLLNIFGAANAPP